MPSSISTNPDAISENKQFLDILWYRNKIDKYVDQATGNLMLIFIKRFFM